MGIARTYTLAEAAFQLGLTREKNEKHLKQCATKESLWKHRSVSAIFCH